MNFFKVILSLFVITVAISCSKNEEINSVDCTTISSSYDKNIKTIISNSCSSAGCHDANSKNGDFTTHVGLKTIATNGNLDKRVIQQRNMPPSGSMSSDDLKKIKCWIESGSPNN